MNAMPDEFELSRRKVLAALGTAGVASAGAGLGTSAFFGDEESFQNNRLVAGELDLKVDWQQTYNGESVNAFPDEDGDGQQDQIRTRESIANEAGLPIDSPSVENTFQAQFADVPDDHPRPLIELDDVKPGDSGSVLFSLHLFDTPGYIWMNGQCETDENGLTEPEAEDPDEGRGVELARTVQVTLWYDDGDGVPTADETVIYEGSLENLQYMLCDGIPLHGDRSTTFPSVNEIAPVSGDGLRGELAANGGGAKRACFENSTTAYLGFSWELPVDHANEIQSDTNRFDLGFYTEQCRHNDGASQEARLFTTSCPNAEEIGWCKYEVTAMIAKSSVLCPFTVGDIICTPCIAPDRETCELSKGETTNHTVTSGTGDQYCTVEVTSLRDACQDGCNGDHNIAPFLH
jgi:hypothetical protein